MVSGKKAGQRGGLVRQPRHVHSGREVEVEKAQGSIQDVRGNASCREGRVGGWLGRFGLVVSPSQDWIRVLARERAAGSSRTTTVDRTFGTRFLPATGSTAYRLQKQAFAVAVLLQDEQRLQGEKYYSVYATLSPFRFIHPREPATHPNKAVIRVGEPGRTAVHCIARAPNALDALLTTPTAPA